MAKTRKAPPGRSAWRRSKGGFRWYLDSGIRWEQGRWRVDGKFADEESAVNRIMQSVGRTMPGAKHVEAEKSGRRWYAEISDVSVGYEDAVARAKERRERGRKLLVAKDPERFIRRARRWEHEQVGEPWLEWAKASGRRVYLAAGYAVESDIDTDLGKITYEARRVHGLGFAAEEIGSERSVNVASRLLARWRDKSETRVVGTHLRIIVE